MLLIDEPTSQLDPKGTEDVFKIIQMLKEKGKTTILVEHKIDRIAEYAGRVLVMDGGQIVMDGSAPEILSDPTLLNYGINVPEVSMLGLKLRESGYDLPQIPITLDQAETLIGTLREGN